MQLHHLKYSSKNAIILFCLIAMLELLGFMYASNQYIAPNYPFGFDQIQYLSESYLVFEKNKVDGFWNAIWYGLSNGVAQGALHDVYAFLVMKINGPNRTSALLVNFLAFLLWQGATFFTAGKLTRSLGAALFSALLILNIQSQWVLGCCGGIFDFRLDYLSAAFTGISLAFSFKTNGFLNRKMSILFGICVGITVATRFITFTYFSLAFALLIVAYYFQPERSRRIINLCISGLIGLSI